MRNITYRNATMDGVESVLRINQFYHGGIPPVRARGTQPSVSGGCCLGGVRKDNPIEPLGTRVLDTTLHLRVLRVLRVLDYSTPLEYTESTRVLEYSTW